MKKTCVFFVQIPILLAASLSASAQGTAFTYQGRLNDGGSPANGIYDLRFILYNAEFGGSQQGDILTRDDVLVTNGLLAVNLDFGANVFTNELRWLEIGVRAGSSTGIFATLSPRQPLTPAPQALYALNAGGAATASTTPWSGLTGVPAEFLDGVDNDTTYSAGAGLTLSGTQFSVSFGGSGGASTVSRSDHTHSAAQIVSGILPDARLAGTYSAPLGFNNERNTFAGAFSGDGKDLKGLDASQLASGTVPNARLNPSVSLLGQTIESAEITDGAIAAADVSAGSFNTTFWRTAGNTGTTAGTHFVGTTDNQPLEIKVNGMRAWRVEAGSNDTVNIIGGSRFNFVASDVIGATIGGGGATSSGSSSRSNSVASDFATIGGGYDNTIEAGNDLSTIGGGGGNEIEWLAFGSTIGGGSGHTISSNALRSTISGGFLHTIGKGALYGTISGGSANRIGTNAQYATVPGGQNNEANAAHSFAAGRHAKANHDGSFVFADSRDFDFPSTAANQFNVRAVGGVRIVTGIDAGGTPTAGVSLNASDTSWNVISDRSAKKNFRPADGREILERLARLPIRYWNYKWEAEDAVPHLGPVAQDFKAAFYRGRDERTISTLEFDGVALAAIQGLNKKVEEKDARIAELERRLAVLETMIKRGNER